METIRYMTYNLQVEGGPPFPFFAGRGNYVKERLPALDADIIGFQEVTDDMRDFLRDAFPLYTFVGSGREADFSDESMLIGYRTDRFEAISFDTFWLSDTPSIPGSRFHTDQSHYPRICTALELLCRKNHRRFRVYNLHLDHIGEIARNQGISVVLSRMAEDYKRDPLPVILSGDFNDLPHSNVIRSVCAFTGVGDTFRDVTDEVGITYHEYHPEDSSRTMKIDYIFTNAPCDKCHSFTVKDHTEDGMYLSDHYPIMAFIRI